MCNTFVKFLFIFKFIYNCFQFLKQTTMLQVLFLQFTPTIKIDYTFADPHRIQRIKLRICILYLICNVCNVISSEKKETCSIVFEDDLKTRSAYTSKTGLLKRSRLHDSKPERRERIYRSTLRRDLEHLRSEMIETILNRSHIRRGITHSDPNVILRAGLRLHAPVGDRFLRV